tara:strand:+ start:274 stop:501 length:228 start_codon:yes stop_codon:yes gene_type:complete
MNNESSGKLESLEYKIPLEDQFLFERFNRGIQRCDDTDTLRYMATYFAKMATQRNAIIKGLIKELVSPDNVIIKS